METWIAAKPDAEAAMQALDRIVTEARDLPVQTCITLGLARQYLGCFRTQLEDDIGKAVQP